MSLLLRIHGDYIRILGIGDDAGHDLEDEWSLDDSQNEIVDSKKRAVRDTSNFEDAFLRQHRPSEDVGDAPTGELPLPVVCHGVD